MQDDYRRQTARELADEFRAYPNGRGIFHQKILGDGNMIAFSFGIEHLEELSRDLSWFHVVCSIERPVFAPFSQHLEMKFFPPGNPSNDLFHYRMFKWEDFTWGICSVPVGMANCCYLAASAVCGRLANGVPHILDLEAGGRGLGNCRGKLRELPGVDVVVGECVFPLNNLQTFTLEPDHQRRGPVLAQVCAVRPAPPPKEPDLLDIILARRKKR